MAENLPEKELTDFLLRVSENLGLTVDIKTFCQHLISIGVTCIEDLHDIRKTKKDIPKEFRMFEMSLVSTMFSKSIVRF